MLGIWGMGEPVRWVPQCGLGVSRQFSQVGRAAHETGSPSGASAVGEPKNVASGVMGHGAWGFSSGERGKEKRVKGWSYLKIHSNISNYFFPFSLSPLTRVPSEKCPLNNCPETTDDFPPHLNKDGDSSRFFVELNFYHFHHINCLQGQD
jgi:hypothetical protein